MTNPLTSREAPDPMTLTGFSPKAQQELERNKFAAVTGGLVNVSAKTYWELHYAAIAWHEHAKAMAELGWGQSIVARPEYQQEQMEKNRRARDLLDSAPLLPQASDTQGDGA